MKELWVEFLRSLQELTNKQFLFSFVFILIVLISLIIMTILWQIGFIASLGIEKIVEVLEEK